MLPARGYLKFGFSRGTPVTSEIVQRMGTYFPDAGGLPGSGKHDLQMTTLDPHDFSLRPGRLRFREPGRQHLDAAPDFIAADKRPYARAAWWPVLLASNQCWPRA